MRHTLSRYVAVGQPGASRLSLPPPRASSGANPTQNIPTASQSSQPSLPVQNAVVQAPATNPAFQAPPSQPCAVHPNSGGASPNSALGDGSAAPAYGSVPQTSANPLAGMAPSDFSQRMLMDYLALVQSQLATMNQVVASTVAHNQALTAQNQALFQELRDLKEHVHALTSSSPGQIPTTEPAAAVSPSVPTRLVTSPVASYEQVTAASWQPSIQTEVFMPVTDGSLGGTAGAVPVVSASQPPGRVPVPGPAAEPAVEGDLQNPLNGTIPLVSASGSTSPSAPQPGSDVGRPAIDDEARLQLLALMATQVAAGTGTALSDNPNAQVAPSEPGDQPQGFATFPKPGASAEAPASAAATVATVAQNEHVATATAVATQHATRPPGRGGRYVGPPRVGPFSRGVGAAVNGSLSWRGVTAVEGVNTGSTVGTGSGTAGNAPNASPSGQRTAIPSRSAKRVDAPGPAGTSGSARQAMNDARGERGAAAAAEASAMERRIGLISTSKELRAIVEEDRLSSLQAVLAAQQLPRLARLAQERLQETQGDMNAGKAAEAELLALRELFLRLVARFSSSSALSSLRPAFMPNYLALTAVSGELHQPPSRAFAGALRQLVTQHVTEVEPEVAAAAVAAVAQLDGTVAPGVLERACKVVVEGPTKLVGLKALVAAGQLAPLGRQAAEAARQVLTGAEVARGPSTAEAAQLAEVEAVDLDAETLVAAAKGVLGCSAAGVAVSPVLLQPLEAAAWREGVLAAVGPSGQLLVARAFVAAGCRPQDAWLDAWEAEVIASLSRASPVQVAALAGVLHTLARVDAATCSCRPRQDFVSAASERLLGAGPGAGVTSGTSACTLALHIGELAAGGGGEGTTAAAVPPPDATRLGAALLAVAMASQSSLDLPDLAALVSGLSLLDVRAPAEVWSALLSRATDAPAAAAAATNAARRALELGLPAGIKPSSLEHFLSVGSKHVSELPAASLVGLLGLAAAVKGKLRPGLVAAVLTRLHDQAGALGARDAAFLFAAVDALSLSLTQPLAAQPLAAASSDTVVPEASLTPVIVLHRTAETALIPDQALAALGFERTVQLLELVARLQQVATSAAVLTAVGIESSAASTSAVAAEAGTIGDANSESGRLMPRGQLLAILGLLQPLLPAASPQTLSALVSSAAALGLSVPPDWLAAVVTATLAAAPGLDPMTWSRTAAALTRCEQLSGIAPGAAGDVASGSWMDVFVEDMQRKLPAAPPGALALTLQVLVAHGRQPSASWTAAFLSAAMPSLEAPLPLTQAQAAGAAAAAASVAAGRSRPSIRSAPGPTPSSATRSNAAPVAAVAAATASSSQPGLTAGPTQGPIASAFTPPQLAQMLGGLATLQLKQYITPAWLAAAIRQVEGRAVHFTYRDLAEALYGVVRLGGVVRDSLSNQLFIVSHTKLSTVPPTLLAWTLAVVAAAEGRKISPKWWEEAQSTLVARLGNIGVVMTTNTAAEGGAAAASWQTSDLCLVVESVLALHRKKIEVGISAALAATLAAVVSHGSGGGGDEVAATLSPDAAVSYVETCGKMPQLGRPPRKLLEQYLSHSIRLLAKFADDGSQAAILLGMIESQQQMETSSTNGKGRSRAKRERKRAMEHASKQGSPFLEHLQSATAVGKILVDMPDTERPTAAASWLASLTAAGAAVAPSLPARCAADVLWLLAKLERTHDDVPVTATRLPAMAAQIEALAARVGGSADASPAADGTTESSSRPALPHDAVVDTVWALQALGFPPSEWLLRRLALALPHRLAALPPADALPLLKVLSDTAEAGARAVAEADATASAAAESGWGTASGSGAAGSWPRAVPVKLCTEVGRYLETHLPVLSNDDLVDFLALAVSLDMKLPQAVTDRATVRLASAAAAGALGGTLLLDAVVSLQRQDAKPSPDQLESFCEVAAEGALNGSIGGLLQIALVAAALFDMGARPEPEWLGMINEAVLDDLSGSTSAGGIRRPQLTARSLVIALHELAIRFEGENYVTLAITACRAAVDDLEGQLAAAEGKLVPELLRQRPEWAWMVPAAAPVDKEAYMKTANMAVVTATDGSDQRSKQQLFAKQQQQEEQEEDVLEEDIISLDPRLLQPLGLSDIVQLLEGLSAARQEPPEEIWELLERAMRPALQPRSSAVGGDSSGPLQFDVDDEGLLGLLEHMRGFRSVASTGLLQDLEGYLGRRMPLQSPEQLAVFGFHCLARSYMPDSKFMRLFRQRVEEILPQTDTRAAMLLINFLVVEAVQSDAQRSGSDSDSSGGSERAMDKHKGLVQSLLERTDGTELVSLKGLAEDGTAPILLITLICNFGLRLPHASSPERQTAWLMALQAMTCNCMATVGWGLMATLLRCIRSTGRNPEPMWLATFYKGLEAAADQASPHDVADAAVAIASAGFQPALAPTLAARLAMTLETRMREFASTDVRDIARLLHAVGVMGHAVRTEVLQAAEMLLATPLARAPEVLRETSEELQALASSPAAGGSGAVERLRAAASAAELMINEMTLSEFCSALKVHAYRPSPRFVDALVGSAWLLCCGTQQVLNEMDERRLRPGASPSLTSPSLAWSNLCCLGNVLGALADWGVKPPEHWYEGVAVVLTALALFGKDPELQQVDAELVAILTAVAALETWGHQLSEQETMALQHALEFRVELCDQRSHPVDRQLVQVLNDGLEDRLAKAKGRADGTVETASVNAALQQQQQQQQQQPPPLARRARKAAESNRPVPSSAEAPSVLRGRNNNLAFGGLEFMGAADNFSTGPAAWAGWQQGPEAPAEFEDLTPLSSGHDSSSQAAAAGHWSMEEAVAKPSRQQQSGPGFEYAAVADAALEIAAAVHATGSEPEVAKPSGSLTGAMRGSGVEPMATTAAAPSVPTAAPARESPVARPEPAPVLVSANAMPASSASSGQPPSLAEDVHHETSSPSASAPYESADVNATSSSRVSFRRLTKAERAAARVSAHRAVPPAPTTSAASGGSDERTRLAISQLLQLMPQSSRPPRVATKVGRADDDEDDDGDSDGLSGKGDESAAVAAAECAASRLAAATAARVAAMATGKSATRRTSRASAKARPDAAAGGRAHSTGTGQGGARLASSAASTTVRMPNASGGSASSGVNGLDPQDPRTWNLLDWQVEAVVGSGAVQQQQPPPGSGVVLPVVEPEVLEP